MAPKITYGESGGDFDKQTRAMQEQAAVAQQLNEKEAQLRASQESTATTEQGAAKVRTGLTEATANLSQALQANVGALGRETEALAANARMLQTQITLRRQLAEIQGGGVVRGVGAGQTTLFASEPPRGGSLAGVPEQQPRPPTGQLAFFATPQAGSRGALPPEVGGIPDPAAQRAAAKEMADYQTTVARNRVAVEELAGAQGAANMRFQASAAIYADSSNALSRHGALTTEFIQALARGDVGLKEFSSQMVSTIGKFGGWIIAGAAIYGVIGMFKDLTEGATESQAAIQQLGRFIPGLGGPAGGGRGQISAAQTVIRDMSTQFNVPIKEVVDSMTVMARTFHTVDDAAQATRAVLAVSRLDLVPTAQAEQYLPAVYRSLGFEHGSQLIGVVNGLNQLQSQFGARVSETLPAFARAAPAAVASGTDPATLAALSALGVRAGLPGNQVGTSLLRSMTNFAFTPGSELTFARFGIRPVAGDYGGLMRQLFTVIDTRAKAGNLAGTDIIQLSRAMAGPLLGGRVAAAMLVQEARTVASGGPSPFLQGRLDFQHPRPYQDDLSAILGTVGEKFKGIGIALQNFGATLYQMGALTPLTTLLDVTQMLIKGFEGLARPVGQVLGLFNLLPGAMHNLLAVLVAGVALRAVSQTRLGSSAQLAVSRIPGLGGLQDSADQRLLVMNQVARMRNVEQPEQQAALMAANRGVKAAEQERQRATAAFNAVAARGQGPSSTGAPLAALGPDSQEGRAYQAELDAANQRVLASQRGVATASNRQAEEMATSAALQADINQLTLKGVSTAAKINYIYARGMVAAEQWAAYEGDAAAAAKQVMASAEATAKAGKVEGAGAVAGAAGLGAAGMTAALFATRGGQLSFGGTAAPGEQLSFDMASAGMGAPGLVQEAATLGMMGRLKASLKSAGGDLMERGPGFFTGMGLPLAGMMLSPMLGGDLGSGLQAGFSDMMIGQLIGKGGMRTSLGAFGFGLATAPGASAGQRILGGGIMGGTAAPLLGKVLSALTPLDAAAPEIGIPLTIASTVIGGLIGDLTGGSSTPPQPITPDSLLKMYRQTFQAPGEIGRLARQKLYQNFGPSAINLAKAQVAVEHGYQTNAFDSHVQNVLESAYFGGSQSQRSQQGLNTMVQGLTAQLQLFGGNSVEGKAATKGLNDIIGGATAMAYRNPAFTQQLVSTALQSRNQEIQRQFQYHLAMAAPGQASPDRAIAATQQIVQPFASRAASIRGQLAQAQETLVGYEVKASGATGDSAQAAQRQVDAQRKVVSELQRQSQAASAINSLAQQNAKLQEQQYASQALQANLASQQADTQLAVANAGGSTMAQLQAQLQGAQRTIASVEAKRNQLSPQEYHNQSEAAAAAASSVHMQIVQHGLDTVQASSAVAEASTPLGNQAADAQAKARAAYQAWQYMKQNRWAFDPNAIKTAWANVLQARKDAIQAVADQATQMNDLNTQLAAAQDYGDPLLQAQIGLRGALRDVSLAVTPGQKKQAQINVAQQQAAVYQATQQHIQDEGQLAASMLPGDPVGQAAALATAAAAALAAAHGTEDIIQKQAALNQANAAYYDAVTQQADMYYQTQQVQDTGNVMAQAAAAAAQAAYDTSRAAGRPGDQAKAALERAQAAQQAHQAAQAVIQENTALTVALDVFDPIAAAKAQIAGTNQQIANAQGRPDELKQLYAQRAQYQYQLHQAHMDAIQQAGSTREAQQSGNQVAAAQTAVNTARQVLATAVGTKEQQQAEAQLAQAEHQLTQARISRMQALAQVGETQDTGNVMAQARDAQRAADRESALAKGRDAQIKAQQDQAAAQQQMIAARQQRAQELGARRESRHQDPLVQARDAVDIAKRELELAHGEDQRIQAETALKNAEFALHQARMQRIESLGGLAEARDSGDAVAQARDALRVADKELASARNESERIAAETKQATAEYQLHQARVARTDALGQLAEAQAGGDSLVEAQVALQVAEHELAMAKTMDERIAAETKVAQANVQLHQALQERVTALGALAASETRDPLAQLQDQIAAARQVLAKATTEQEKISASTNLNSLLNQYESAVVTQTEDTINFQLQMRQITAQQAIAQLQALLKTQDLTIQERQQIEGQIRQLQLGGGTSEFNLAPGSIKLPTVYDIARAMGGSLSGASSPFGTGTVNATAYSTINVYVGNDGDVQKVAAAIDNATGSQVAGALRAAGLA